MVAYAACDKLSRDLLATNPWHRKGRDSFSAKLPANLKVRELRDRLLSLADMAKYYHDDLLPTRIRMENRRGKA